jgi:nucleotide-binding universal stress UspA family protein
MNENTAIPSAQNTVQAQTGPAGPELGAAAHQGAGTRKRVLVPIDFSPAGEAALSAAVKMAGRDPVSICLLHVIESASFLNGMRDVPIALTDEEMVREAQQDLQELARRAIPPEVPVNYVVRIGKVERELERAAAEADVVLVAPRKYTGLKRWWFGSATSRILRQSRTPVMAVG